MIARAKGITADSRKVRPGFIFVAIKGQTVDGRKFITEAKKKGAIAVFEGREKLGELAADFYGNPSHRLKVIGVTGTKGKTTTCHLIHHILTKLGHKTGLISSITTPGYHVTTPETEDLHCMLKEMVDEGCEYAVIEVSSHGIDQKRIAGVKFAATVLTNIAPEHLDYHKTFANYKKVKLRFLKMAPIRVIAPKKTDLAILPGSFNNLNAEVALRVCEKLGIKREMAISALKTFKLPQGRLEEVENNLGIKIVIDFAHTPESLKEALTYLRSQTKGKLIAVFGCAGQRDPRKRAKMGKISTQIADLSVFTAEDPRTENIFDILRKMRSRVTSRNFVSIPERGEAIAYALSVAKKGDIIGIFGKGHEQSMCWQTFEHPWSDKEFVKSYLKSRKDIAAVVLAAGKGTRMKSQKPKVLREICGRPMLAYTLENLRKAGIQNIVVIVGFRKNLVIRRFGGAVKFAVQKNPKGGTADSVKAGIPNVPPKCKTLVVINGDDSAFYQPQTIQKIVEIHEQENRKLTFVSLLKDDPTGLGRVIRGKNGFITKIVEEKDASPEEKKIKEVNDGLYVFEKKWLTQNIKKVKKGPQGEYYLVDLVKIAIDQKDKIGTYTLPDDSEWHGINTPEQLEEAQEKMAERLKSQNG